MSVTPLYEDTSLNFQLPKVTDDTYHEIVLHLQIEDGVDFDSFNTKMHLNCGEITRPGTYVIKYIWHRGLGQWIHEVKLFYENNLTQLSMVG